MIDLFKYSLCQCLLIILGRLNGQPLSYQVEIGETVSIHSKFTGLPVVEPNLSVHPADNDHLLIAAMVITNIDNPYQSARLATFVSTDSGESWEESVHDYWGYDPWTSILPNGKTALSWLGTSKTFQHRFPIQFFSSNDGGISWDKDVQTINATHGHDGTKIVSSDNNFYFTTVRFNDDMSADVILYHKFENGDFIEVSKVEGKGTRLNFCEPVILSDGMVLVPSSHFLQKVWVSRYDPKTKKLSDKKLITMNPGGAKGYMRMTTDINPTSKFFDRIYFVRATGRGMVHEGVWLNYSIDKGKTWSKDIRVDHFLNDYTCKAMVASVAVNGNGVVGISWVDSQEEKNQTGFDVYFSYSIDGGNQFSDPIRISDISTNPNTPQNGDVANKFPGGGHYLDLRAKPDNSFQFVWSDSRSGYFELQTCNVQLKVER